MYKLFLFLFLTVSEQAKREPAEIIEPPVSQSSHLLPLIMIKTKDALQPPTYLEKPDFSKKEPAGLGINTQFKRDDEEGEIVYFCPANVKYAKIIKSQNEKSPGLFNPNCLFKKTFRKSISRSFQELKCDQVATPIVIKHESTRESENGVEKFHSLCGPGNKGKLYEFVYELCMPLSKKEKIGIAFKSILKRNNQELPCARFEYFKLYKFCFDHVENTTIYTEHQVIEPTLFAQREMWYDSKKEFNFMTDGYGYFNDVFEQQALVYEEKQIFAQKLVPSDHLFFGIWKKAAYHLANTKPQNENLSSLWTEIIRLILLNSTSMIAHTHLIYTGAFNFPKEEGTSSNTDEPSETVELSMPDIWICIVIQISKNESSTTDATKGVVFIMSNYIKNKETEQRIDEYCQMKSCQIQLVDKFIAVGGYIKCCSVTSKILQFFGFADKEIGEVLYIHNLNAQTNIDFFNFNNPIN